MDMRSLITVDSTDKNYIPIFYFTSNGGVGSPTLQILPLNFERLFRRKEQQRLPEGALE